MALGLRQPAVSKHLGVLREVGIVSVSKEGQHRVYELNFDQLRPVYDWVKTFERHWEHQLDRIRARAERRALAASTAAGRPTRKKGTVMTTALQSEQAIETVEIQKTIDIAAPIEIAFEAMLDELGPDAQMMDGTPMPFKLEPGRAGDGFAIWETTPGICGATCR